MLAEVPATPALTQRPDERRTSYRIPGAALQSVKRPIRAYSEHLFYVDLCNELAKRKHPRYLEREWLAALREADERDLVRKLTADNAREDASYFERQPTYELHQWAEEKSRAAARDRTFWLYQHRWKA